MSSSSPPRLSLRDESAGYIEHAVSKFDTLAGVAIKYGVEVADIRKMNGLVTDHQMFALPFLQIPRHPPSHSLSNASISARSQSSSDRSPRFTCRKASQAMNSLQSYYGLKEISHNSTLDDSLHQSFSHCRKSKSLVQIDENDSMPPSSTNSDQLAKRIRRRQKSETDFRHMPEMLLEDNSTSGGFSKTAITGKCLALRPKASRTAEVENGNSSIASSSVDAPGVKKSSSTSNLQDASIWPTSKWSLKPDLQVFSTKTAFDGLPKPTPARRNKAALD